LGGTFTFRGEYPWQGPAKWRKKKRKITNEQKEKQIKEKALNAAVQCKYKGPH